VLADALVAAKVRERGECTRGAGPGRPRTRSAHRRSLGRTRALPSLLPSLSPSLLPSLLPPPPWRPRREPGLFSPLCLSACPCPCPLPGTH
jgi:hypothetical protein